MNIIDCFIEYNPADGEIVEIDLYSLPSHFVNYITVQGEEFVIDPADILANKKVDINANPKVLIDKYTQAELDAIALADAKKAKRKAINARTKELIAEGFTFDGAVFSYSGEAQLNWTAMKAAAEIITYPIEISVLDDEEDDYELTEANSAAFFATAVAVKQAHLDSGRALRRDVRLANTIPEVDDVVDNR